MERLIKQVFSDVYNGTLTTNEAGKILHVYCNGKGLNPALEMPVTMLMLSEVGRKKLQSYETFQTHLSWLMAKVSAQAITIDMATSHFWTYINKLDEERLEKNYKIKEKEEKRLKSYFRMISCPTCGLQGKMAGGYQDIN